MKIIKKNITLLVFVCVCVIACVVFAYIFAKYSSVNKQITDIQTQHNQLSDFSLTYSNDEQKYHNIEIAANDTHNKYSNEFEFNGVYFATDIEGIDKQKLKDIALELFYNLHGDEIDYVSSVVLRDGEEKYCTGSQYNEIAAYEIPVSLYNFLGQGVYYKKTTVSHLVIDNVKADTKVEDMAQALSVAYGYHFVDYYNIVKGTDEDINTKYYEMRGNDNENIVFTLADDETMQGNLTWYLKNIAAYDYMYMMGSSNANRFVEVNPRLSTTQYFHLDTKEYADIIIKEKYKRGRNSNPHINVDFPMPDEVEGLYEYFYSFIDATTPVFEMGIEPIEANFKLESEFKSFPGFSNARLYTLTWDMITEDPNIIVTVVKYDMNDEMLSMESIMNGNVNTSVIENVIRFYIRKKVYSHYPPERHTYPTKTVDEFKIRLIAYYPDGRVRVSEPYIFNYADH